MIKLKIDVTKIDKTALFRGAKGVYADITLMENRDGTDQYGNDGFIVQDLGKDRRLAGEKGPILGNFKRIEFDQPKPAPQQARPVQSAAVEDDDMDAIPF